MLPIMLVLSSKIQGFKKWSTTMFSATMSMFLECLWLQHNCNCSRICPQFLTISRNTMKPQPWQWQFFQNLCNITDTSRKAISLLNRCYKFLAPQYSIPTFYNFDTFAKLSRALSSDDVDYFLDSSVQNTSSAKLKSVTKEVPGPR